MVDRDAFDYRLQQHGFAGAGGGYNERALAVANWRNQVDRSASKLGSALRGLAGFELELPLRVRSDERAEIRSARCFGGIDAVDLLDIDDHDAIAMIVAGCGENLVAAAQHVLPHHL